MDIIAYIKLQHYWHYQRAIKCFLLILAIKSFTKKLNDSFALNNITGITFYSKLAVDTFLMLASKYKILKQVRNMPVYCISDRVAKPLIHKQFKSVYVAKEPNERSLIASINKKHFIAC